MEDRNRTAAILRDMQRLLRELEGLQTQTGAAVRDCLRPEELDGRVERGLELLRGQVMTDWGDLLMGRKASERGHDTRLPDGMKLLFARPQDLVPVLEEWKRALTHRRSTKGRMLVLDTGLQFYVLYAPEEGYSQTDENAGRYEESPSQTAENAALHTMLSQLRDSMLEEWCVFLGEGGILNPEARALFLQFCTKADLSDAQAARLRGIWMVEGARQNIRPEEFLSGWLAIMGEERAGAADAMGLEPVVYKLISWLGKGGFSYGEEGQELLRKVLALSGYQNYQVVQIVKAAEKSKAWQSSEFRGQIYAWLLSRGDIEMSYRWKAEECRAFADDTEEGRQRLRELLEIAGQRKTGCSYRQWELELLDRAALVNACTMEELPAFMRQRVSSGSTAPAGPEEPAGEASARQEGDGVSAAAADMERELLRLSGMGDYEQAAALMKRRMGFPAGAPGVLKEILQTLFADQILRESNAVRELIPELFAYLRWNLMNYEEVTNRQILMEAVRIARTSGQETPFFKVFGMDYLQGYPEQCVCVLVSLLLRDALEQAAYWLGELHRRIGYFQHVTLLQDMVSRGREKGMLSDSDKLLLRTIPADGRRISRESIAAMMAWALDRDMAVQALRAFGDLAHRNKGEREAYYGYMMLSSALPHEQNLEALDYAAQKYVELGPDNMSNRSMRCWAVIRSCLRFRYNDKGSVTASSLLNTRSPGQKKALLSLEERCMSFLQGEENALREELLLRAATGWWRIDQDVLRIFADAEDLLRELVQLYPISFAGACYAAVLDGAEQGDFRMDRWMRRRDGTRRLEKSIHNIRFIRRVAADPEESARMRRLLNRPLEATYMYTHVFGLLLDGPDGSQLENEISAYLSLQPWLTVEKYHADTYKLKTTVASQFPQYQELVLHCVEDTAGETSGEAIPLLKGYLNNGSYEMLEMVAVEWETKLHGTQTNHRQEEVMNLCRVYHNLADALTLRRSSFQMKELLNMSIVLCSSKAWDRLEILMDCCTSSYDRVCLRCVQELLQGNPSDILYAVDSCVQFRENGAVKMVGQAVYMAFRSSEFRKSLRSENKNAGRDQSWGFRAEHRFDRKPDRASWYIVPIGTRNPVSLPPLREDIDRLLGLTAPSPAPGDAPVRADQDPAALQTATAQAAAAQTKAAQAAAAQAAAAVPQQVPPQAADTGEIRAHIEDCLTRYERLSRGDGFLSVATKEARDAFYETADYLPGYKVDRALSGRIRAGLQTCLSGYERLTDLIGDCRNPAVDVVLDAVQDDQLCSSIRRYIDLVRGIGQEKELPRSNARTLDWLEDCVARARRCMDNLNNDLCMKLIELLNREIRQFRGRALLQLEILPCRCSRESPHLRGVLRNTGAERATDIHLELQIDGILCRSYSVRKMEGNSTVPFDLLLEPQERRDSLEYRITASYSSERGETGWMEPVEGEQKLLSYVSANEYMRLGAYKVDAPAEGEDYIDRKDIQRILDAGFGPSVPFERFPNLAVYGMKRTGKTSILRHLDSMLQQRRGEKIYTVQVSGEGTFGTVRQKVCDLLIYRVIEKLEGSFRSVPQWGTFADKWERLPDVVGGGSAVRWDRETARWIVLAQSGRTQWGWLIDFYAELVGQFCRTGIVVMVDEVENLYLDAGKAGEIYEDAGLWNTLSAITQEAQSMVRFVLCGSDYFINKVNEGDTHTQFFQRIRKLRVGRMSYSELEQAMQGAENVKFSGEAFRYLWEITRGLPWHARVIGNAVIEEILIMEEDSIRNNIVPSDILWATNYILDSPTVSSRNNFGLAALSEDERIVVQVLTQQLTTSAARMKRDQLQTQSCGLMEGEEDGKWQRFERALQTLCTERQLLTYEIYEQTEYYRFGCELYRLYNRREKPVCLEPC